MKTTALQELLTVAKKYSVPPRHLSRMLNIKHQTLSAWRRRNVLPLSYIPRVEDLTAMITSLGEKKIFPISEVDLIGYGLSYLSSKGESNGRDSDEKDYSGKLSSSYSSE